jgi:hypothetical protein
MSNPLPSYNSIKSFGYPETRMLLLGEVEIQEKVDGSQISFGMVDGELCMRSKGAFIDTINNTNKMFWPAVEAVRAREHLLKDGHIYCGEYLQRPKHNTLAYDRIPKDHIMIYDVGYDTHTPIYEADPERRAAEAERIGFEVIPTYYKGPAQGAEMLQSYLTRTSVLGAQRIEGVVIKSYHRFGADGKPLMGKLVRDDFKEQNNKDFRARNPAQSDVVVALVEKYRCIPRWEKAVQHLRDRGELEGTPKDIGKLILEAQADLLAEAEGEIKEALFRWAKSKVTQGAVMGLPEWYKAKLMEGAFDGDGQS